MPMASGDGRAMLEGIKVVDLTSVVFGPYCTQLLADLGADVVKVEPPVIGDAFRWSGKAVSTPGMSPGFMALNRGKTSLALDLKKDEDLERMRELIAGADVFVHNVRAKGVARLGLDEESVRRLNPGIIYIHCVGFAQDGPYADLQAYDDVIQAASGTASLLARVDGNPRPRYLPSLIADKVAGLNGAYAALAAVIHKMRTGEGQHVIVPMFEVFTNFMLLEHLAGQTFDPPNGPICYSRQIDPDRQPFPASDGYLSIVAYTDEAWPTVFEVLGDPGFLDDERFATRALRARNLALLYRRMAELTPNFTCADLLKRLQAAQIPAQIVRDMSEVIEDEHLKATGFFRKRAHPTEGDYLEMRPPVRFGAYAYPDRGFPPRIGEHGPERTGERLSKGQAA